MTPRELEKYLRKALIRPVEPETPAGLFRHFIAIPVMDELEELPGTLAVLQSALAAVEDAPGILLVVNHGPNAAPERKAHNLELLEQLRSGKYPGVYWVDAASPGKELTNGVGEARRIGMDTALSLLDLADPEHAYIVCLDADSHVSPDYWPVILAEFAAHPEYGTLSIGVSHRTGKNEAEENAIRKYEKFMDDYVAELRNAGSPYAFHTIGSAMAIRASVYTACGGMRVRSGGEDFYFLQAAAKVPLLIAVDEEGGTVNRLSAYTAFRAEPFPAPMSLYHAGGWLAVHTDTLEKCSLLRELGISVNLAPVADVSNPGTYMYPRSFGADAALTEQYVDEVVRGYESAGMGCVLKHFPGYGDNVDTHTGVSRDTRTLEELAARDLRPFAAGIAAGADCVLMSHNVVTALDPTLPASLSPAVYTYLRENMGFTGVAMTDDLSMGGVRAFAGDGEAAVQALRAGCDLICSADAQRELAAVLAAVERGELSEARLNEAAQRVLCWKIRLGLLG